MRDWWAYTLAMVVLGTYPVAGALLWIAGAASLVAQRAVRLSRPATNRLAEEGYQRSAFHSDFVVDPGTEGAFLRSVLADLPTTTGGRA